MESGSHHTYLRLAAAAAFLCAAANAAPRAAEHPIDVTSSTLRVYVGKAGLFSAFGDNHVIAAPISAGTISDSQPLAVTFAVSTADLDVEDPGVDRDTRAEVRAKMLGPEVLDAPRFPEIRFQSTDIQPNGTDKWSVAGQLTIHGVTRPITASTSRVGGRYKGEVTIKQRDFGIEPIRIAGGTVKVKDELKIRFDIAPAATSDR